MPVDRTELLTDLKKWVIKFEDDLREQCKEVPELDERLKAQYKEAKDAGRTAFAYSVWRDGELTQAAVGWVLSCVFVRFLEDNDLLEKTFLSGVGERREEASEVRAAYFGEHRTDSDNDYLAHVFREVGKLPGMADLMDERHNALWNAAISGDVAKEFIEFWRHIDPASGSMTHDFTDAEWDTRFLGDLYQDLSESARKKFALLQTPDFVEEFILDRTLDPAIDTFGLKEVRMIDPTCGSGHFLLGGFRRLLALWQKSSPELDERELAIKALSGVYGVDINPFAVAIGRFRLLLAAWRFCQVKQLRSAPDFTVNLAVGDSLLHGRRFAGTSDGSTDQFFDTEDAFRDEIAHFFKTEDTDALHRILGQQYHAVVGNPPYITVKDKALNQLYRARYDSCSGKYALSVPFLERFFDLALTGSGDGREPAGFTGQITGNAFMKRKFGKKLIEEQIPRWDLTHVIDTSGAFIPGHGTPTVILFGRNAKPATSAVRTVMGIKGEQVAPADPANAGVWKSIVDQVDRPGSESDYVSAADLDRERFFKFPWSLTGGGAGDAVNAILDAKESELDAFVRCIGPACFAGVDDPFEAPPSCHERWNIPASFVRPFAPGDCYRDWQWAATTRIFAPYDEALKLAPFTESAAWCRHLWPARSVLESVVGFGKQTRKQAGESWHSWYRWIPSRLSSSRWLTFSFVSTHNHFNLVTDRLFPNRSAPVVVLNDGYELNDHLRLLGLLNSAAACFWMKQVFHCKGGQGINEGAKAELWERFYEFDGTKMKQFPVPIGSPFVLAQELDRSARELSGHSPDALAARDAVSIAILAEAEQTAAEIRARMISLQEELDWQCYRHYCLVETSDELEWPEDRLDDLPSLTPGERAFEIGMARQMAAGELETAWFERHKEAGSKSITELPAAWPDDYRALVERRLAFIEANKNINLIERPEYKRRWNTEPWAKRQDAALRRWLLTRLEGYFGDSDRILEGNNKDAQLTHVKPIRGRFAGGGDPALVSLRQLAAAAESDSQWMEAAAVYAGRDDYKVAKLVENLVLLESVPFLPSQRYKQTGHRKRIEWEATWERQREEDAVEASVVKKHPDKSEEELKPLIRQAQEKQVGDIPVPPKYASKDFAKTIYWKLRGKLDVPKERWVVYLGAEGGHDDSPVIAWAGWNHAQQAQALAGYYQLAKDTWGWEEQRLAPLLAGLKDLLPWLHQWHNDIDPTYSERLSTIYQQFYETERHALRLSDEDVEAIRLGTS